MIRVYRVIGAAGPVVVLMSGAGMKMSYWEKVASSLAGKCRVVAYDRSSSAVRSLSVSNFCRDQTEDLLELLASLDLPPPYYLVGHSLGGSMHNSWHGTIPNWLPVLFLQMQPILNRTHALPIQEMVSFTSGDGWHGHGTSGLGQAFSRMRFSWPTLAMRLPRRPHFRIFR